jgi:hypothetical protein
MRKLRYSAAAAIAAVLVLVVASACLSQGQWAVGGVVVTNRANPRGGVVAPDGAGGAIIAWSDWESETGDIFAQRIDSLGAPRWGKSGVVVCNVSGKQSSPVIVTDGAGGAIVAWPDEQSRPTAAAPTRWPSRRGVCRAVRLSRSFARRPARR